MKNAIKRVSITTLAAIVAVMMIGTAGNGVYAGIANTIYVEPTSEMDSEVVTDEWSSDQMANNTLWCLHSWHPVENGVISGYGGFRQCGSASERYCFLSIRNSDSSVSAKTSLQVLYKNKLLKAEANTYHHHDTEVQCWTPFNFSTGNWYRMTLRCWKDGKGNLIYGQWIKDISKDKWYLIIKVKAIGKENERFGYTMAYQDDNSDATDGERSFKLRNYYESMAQGQWIPLDQVNIHVPKYNHLVGTVNLSDASQGYFAGNASDEPNESLTYDYSDHIAKVELNQWKAPYDEPFTISSFKPTATSKGKITTALVVPVTSTPIFSYKINIYNSKLKLVKTYNTKYPNVTSGKLSSSLQYKLASGTYIVNVDAISILGQTASRSFKLMVD